MTWRPWIVGANPAEPIGSSVGDGITGRVADPVTGAGLFNPNTDPNVVGVDPLTGSDAPAGTDMSFGSAIRRQVHTNVINGDFAVLPPGGVGSSIDSDPASAGYNPLPGWTWVPDGDGLTTASVVADAAYGSGYKVALTAAAGTAGGSYLEQLIPVPMSQGQQYRVLLSVYGSSTFMGYKYQYLKADLTAIGSQISSPAPLGSAEVKLDAGLVPPTAAYLRMRVGYRSTSGVGYFGEVRSAFLPAEATLGLGALDANTVSITTAETQVKGVTIPANSFVVGSVYRITGWATVTSSVANVVTIRCRVGPTTLTGAIATSMNPTATTTASNSGVRFEVMVTVRSVGGSGTVFGSITMIGLATPQPFAVGFRTEVGTGTTTVDTTVANILELTAVTAAGTTSIVFRQCVIECVMAS